MKLAQIDFSGIADEAEISGKLPTDIGGAIVRAIPYIFAFAGIGLLIFLIMGGFKLMTSGGDPKKIEEGKHTITNAFLGFIIVFVAYWIVQILGIVLDLEGIGNVFKQP